MKKLFLTALCATAFASSLYCAESELPRWVCIEAEKRRIQEPYNQLVQEAITALTCNRKATFYKKVAKAKPLYEKLIALEEELATLPLTGGCITCDYAPDPFPLDEKGELTPYWVAIIQSRKDFIASQPKPAKQFCCIS